MAELLKQCPFCGSKDIDVDNNFVTKTKHGEYQWFIGFIAELVGLLVEMEKRKKPQSPHGTSGQRRKKNEMPLSRY